MAWPLAGLRSAQRAGAAASGRRDPARLFVAALLWALLAALAVQGARLVWAIVTPLGPVGAWQARSASILPAAERAALFAAFDPFNRTDTPGTDGPVTVTALNLKLFGIRLNEAAGGGSAIIAGEDGVQNSIGVGEDIAPGVTLYAVAFDHIVIDRGGTRETLYLDQSVPADSAAPAAAAGDNDVGEAASPAAPAGSAALTPDAIRSEVRFAPRASGTGVTGIVVQPQGSGAALRAAGLRPGDVITSVNGRPVTSAGDVAALAGQLSPGARLSLQIERGSAIVPVALILSPE